MGTVPTIYGRTGTLPISNRDGLSAGWKREYNKGMPVNPDLPRVRSSATQINQPLAEAAASRARQSRDHERSIARAQSRVERREKALAQARKPVAIERAKRKLQLAQNAVREVRLFGSRTGTLSQKKSR